MTRRVQFFNTSSQFVANGLQRAMNGIEAEVRPVIEQKHAHQWNASGFFKRWLLRRQIEREITECIAERLASISPDSLF
ncbi:hypothetical protein RMSM_04442 [Rhodopirellula maiorica SM1]|uniref:Uncharacterized protein n=1 Tax=Rhodopirellula maiorica SM1 TaxID=1265738 RepID=M5RHH5_9BACT|nr:hypothetical protein RMSM_04442 [Rhodopirellula maiorica SM1]